MIRKFIIVVAIFAFASESSGVVFNRAETRISLVMSGDRTGSFPWTVALMDNRDTVPRMFCGGTLISDTFVISGKLLYLVNSQSHKILKKIQLRTAFSIKTTEKN